MSKSTDIDQVEGVTRRGFLKIAGVAGLFAAFAGTQAFAADKAASAKAASSAKEKAAASAKAGSAASAKGGTRTVTGTDGKSYEVPATINKICSTYGGADEYYFVLGATDKMCALNGANKDNKWMKKLAPKVFDLPQVFDNNGNYDTEALLKAAPDVIICRSADEAGKVKDATGLATVAAMGTDPDTLKALITLDGDLLGKADVAKKLCGYYDDNRKQATDRTSALTMDDRTRVYYASSKGYLNTEGQDTIVDSWIQDAGGTNMATYGGVEGTFKDIKVEDLINWDPEVVVCCSEKIKQDFMADSNLSALTAVQNGAVYVSPTAAYVWCVRAADAVMMPLWAATKIQPDKFSDVDYDKITKDFYKEFLNYDLSQDEIDEILVKKENGD